MSNPTAVPTPPTNPDNPQLGPAIKIRGARIIDEATHFDVDGKRIYPIGTELTIADDTWKRVCPQTWHQYTAAGHQHEHDHTGVMFLLAHLDAQDIQFHGRHIAWATKKISTHLGIDTATITSIVSQSHIDTSATLKEKRESANMPIAYLAQWTGYPEEFIKAYESQEITLTPAAVAELQEFIDNPLISLAEVTQA